MRFLISAVNFNEAWRMASRRPRALAESLAKRGHDVTVLTIATDPADTAPPPPGVEIIETAPYPNWTGAPVPQIPLVVRVAAALSVLSSTPESIILKHPQLCQLLRVSEETRQVRLAELNWRRMRTVTGVKRVFEDLEWYQESAPIMRRMAKEEEPYDVVFATYSTYGSIWLGYLAQSTRLARHLIVDFRDLMDQPGPLLPLRLLNKAQQRRAVRKADAVTVVSKGLRTNILEDARVRRYADKIHVLYNGFIRETDGAPGGDSGEGGPLKIAYTGSLYQGQRDATPLFAAIRQARTDDPSLHFEVHYAGGAGAQLVAMAEAEGVADCVVDHGFVPPEDAIHLQAAADVLLALSWNMKGNEGILTGKFPEYLAQEKPIMSIVAADLPGAELTELVNDMGLGLGVECPPQPGDEERLITFLQDAAKQVASGKHLQWDADPRDVARFDYESLTTRLEDLTRELDK